MKWRGTLLVPEAETRHVRYLAEENQGGGDSEGQSDGEQTPEAGSDTSDDSPEIPDKFKGKSTEELIKSHQELEKKLGTRVDPEEIRGIKEGLTRLEQAITAKAKDDDENNDDSELQEQHKEYLRKLGVPIGIDLDAIEERVAKNYELKQTVRELEQKYDGSDGKPKFDAKEISKYAIDNELSSLNPEVVYELKYKKELRDWDIAKALKGNKSHNVPEGKGRQKTTTDEKDIVTMSEDERKEYLTQKYAEDM